MDAVMIELPTVAQNFLKTTGCNPFGPRALKFPNWKADFLISSLVNGFRRDDCYSGHNVLVMDEHKRSWANSQIT